MPKGVYVRTAATYAKQSATKRKSAEIVLSSLKQENPDKASSLGGLSWLPLEGYPRAYVAVTCPAADCGRARLRSLSDVKRALKKGAFTGYCSDCRYATLRGRPHREPYTSD